MSEDELETEQKVGKMVRTGRKDMRPGDHNEQQKSKGLKTRENKNCGVCWGSLATLDEGWSDGCSIERPKFFNQSEYYNCGQKCCTRRTSRSNNPLITSLAIDQGIGNAVVTFSALRIPKTSVNRTLSDELALWDGQISGYENREPESLKATSQAVKKQNVWSWQLYLNLQASGWNV